MKFESIEVILKNGEQVKLREATEEDAKAFIDFTKSILSEGVNQLTRPEEFNFTVEQEKEWIRSKATSKNDLAMTATYNNEVVGILTLETNSSRQRISHVGTLGISVAKSFRDQKLGTLMMMEMIKWAKNHPVIEVINLAVVSSNERAIHVYKKLGFIKEGERKNFLKFSENNYGDDVLMSLWVKNV